MNVHFIAHIAVLRKKMTLIDIKTYIAAYCWFCLLLSTKTKNEKQLLYTIWFIKGNMLQSLEANNKWGNVTTKIFHVLTENQIYRTSASSNDSDQPLYSRCLIRVFVVRMKKLCILGYPKCAQCIFWLDCANAKADLNIRWAHMSEITFCFDTATHMSP